MKKNPYYDPNKTHHTPEGFTNPEPNEHRPGDLKRWQNERKKNRLPLKPVRGYGGLVERWWQPVDLAQVTGWRVVAGSRCDVGENG